MFWEATILLPTAISQWYSNVGYRSLGRVGLWRKEESLLFAVSATTRGFWDESLALFWSATCTGDWYPVDSTCLRAFAWSWMCRTAQSRAASLCGHFLEFCKYIRNDFSDTRKNDRSRMFAPRVQLLTWRDYLPGQTDETNLWRALITGSDDLYVLGRIKPSADRRRIV